MRQKGTEKGGGVVAWIAFGLGILVGVAATFIAIRDIAEKVPAEWLKQHLLSGMT
jgi:ABC-type antimicrobial peptide transport system permease subunit